MTFLVVTKYKKKQGNGSVFNDSASRHHSTDRYLIFILFQYLKGRKSSLPEGGKYGEEPVPLDDMMVLRLGVLRQNPLNLDEEG